MVETFHGEAFDGKGATQGRSIEPLTFNDVLEAIARLSEEEQETIAEIVRRRIIEQRREEIAHNAKIARQQYRESKLRRGTLEELEQDLLSGE